MKKILSIDGGGVRGIIPCMILNEIVKRTGKDVPELFDLVAGTSSGGILALGMTIPDEDNNPKHTPESFMELYSQRGKDVFYRSFWQTLYSVNGFTDEKYSHLSLEKVLDDYFNNDIMADCLTKVMISSYDIENRKPFFFKSWSRKYAMCKLKQVARATSAAPAYFEPIKLNHEKKSYALIDGAIFVNNPAMSAYIEARKLFPEEDDFLVISLGTGRVVKPYEYKKAKSWGFAGWTLPALEIMYDELSNSTDYQLRNLLGDNYFRIQRELVYANEDIDDVSPKNTDALMQEANEIIEYRSSEIDYLCNLLVKKEKKFGKDIFSKFINLFKISKN